MANIDLRPWREERRKARQQQFLTILVGFAVAAGAAGFFWNQSVQGQISFQNQRNAYLENKIKELDGKIKEIQNLRQQREELIERMNVIQSLQGDRPIIVHVFEQLVTTTPEDVYFKDLQLQGDVVRIKAHAEKTLSISDFLRNLEGSEWFDSAFLQGMQAVKEGQEVVGHNFELQVRRVKPSSGDEEESS